MAAPQFGCLTWSSFVEALSEFGFKGTRKGAAREEVFIHSRFRRGDFASLADVRPTSDKGNRKLFEDKWQQHPPPALATAAGQTTTRNTGKKRARSSPTHPLLQLTKAPRVTRTWLPPPCCAACGGENGTRVSCRVCDEEYHPRCLDPPAAVLADTGWVCGACRPPARRSGEPCPSFSKRTNSPSRAKSTSLVSSMLARLSADSPAGGARPGNEGCNAAGSKRNSEKSSANDVADQVLAWAFRSTASRKAARQGGGGDVPTSSGARTPNMGRTSCVVCDEGGTHAICVRCEHAFHLGCVQPPLARIPGDEWVCSSCMLPMASCDRPPSESIEVLSVKVSINEGRKGEQTQDRRGAACVPCAGQSGNVGTSTSCAAVLHPDWDDPRLAQPQADDRPQIGVVTAKRAFPGVALTPDPSGWPAWKTARLRVSPVRAPPPCSAPVCKVKISGKIGKCKSCDAAVHLNCMDPPRRQIPNDKYPFTCVACRSPSGPTASHSKVGRARVRPLADWRPEHWVSCSSPSCKVKQGAVGYCQFCKSTFHPLCMNPPRRSLQNKSPYTCVACRSTLSPAAAAAAAAKPKRLKKSKVQCSVCSDPMGSVGFCVSCDTAFHPRCMEPFHKRAPLRYACVVCRAKDKAQGGKSEHTLTNGTKSTAASSPVRLGAESATREPSKAKGDHKGNSKNTTRAARPSSRASFSHAVRPIPRLPGFSSPVSRAASPVSSRTAPVPSPAIYSTSTGMSACRRAVTASSPAFVSPGSAASPSLSSPAESRSPTTVSRPAQLPGFSLNGFSDGDRTDTATGAAAERGTCVVCDAEGGKLNVCGVCKQLYHSRCLSRPRIRLAGDVWRCDKCREPS